MDLLRVPVMTALVLFGGALGAADRLPESAALPADIAAEVEAVVRVDDGSWLLGQAATLGDAGAAPARRWLAEVVYNLRSTAGVDLTRPSLLAWRSGAAPLLAVIPVADRERFVDDFGALRHLRRLLVRTGERDGTIVYQQVVGGQIWNYRLLLRNDYAYLARSAEECRALAEQVLELRPDAPALSAEWRGSFLARELAAQRRELLDFADDRVPLLDGSAITAMNETWNHLLGQVAMMRLQVRFGETDGDAVVGALNMRARSNTPLAAWIGRQTNTASRLLGLVSRPDDLFSVHGAVRWDGEIEALGRLLAEVGKEVGDHVDDAQMVEDVREYFALADRSGPFALAASAHTIDDPDSGMVVRAVSEQPRAPDLVTLRRSIDLLQAEDDEVIGEFEAIAGLLGYAVQYTDDQDKYRHRLMVASRDYVLQVESRDRQRALVELRSMVEALDERRAPSGEPGTISLRLHFSTLIDLMAVDLDQPPLEVEDLAIDLAARVDGEGGMGVEVVVPVSRIQEAVARLGLGREGR